MSEQRVHQSDTVEMQFSGLERLEYKPDSTGPTGPVVTYADGRVREIKPKERMMMGTAAVARSLERWVI